MAYRLTEEGEEYLRKGLPEENLVKILAKGPVKLRELKEELYKFDIALAWAKKKGWVTIHDGMVKLISSPKTSEEYDALGHLDKGESIVKDVLDILVKRGLVEEIREDIYTKAEKFSGKEIGLLESELIKTGKWREVKFRHYNVSSPGQRIQIGKKHILTVFAEKARKIFLDLGFTEASGPLVESTFWCFDSLFQPQDHPARDLADTFYMKNPREVTLPNGKIVDSVKRTHEHGSDTGSIGWRYSFSEAVSKQPILRTHTTAVSARSLAQIKPPAKIFCLGRIFRNETIDYKHLAEFTQVEGIVVDENVNFRDHLGYLKEFYNRMGFEKIRFRPAYFPYTEMSVEPELYFEERGEWMEMGGSGIFRPEVVKPLLGIDCPVLAWGLGLERLIMLKYGIADIRNFYVKNDLRLLRDSTIIG
ncbi:MAG: phenylalanine--tRNA ligase subunit alpha [Candidatus Aenigmatarchaeota archaeon]